MNTTATQKLGTENLKRVIAFLLITSAMIVELFKQFSLTKGAALAFHIADHQDLLQVGPAALAEVRDLDVKESEEIADFIGDKFDLDNDALEARIEEAIDLIPEVYAQVKSCISLANRVTNFVRTWGELPTDRFEELQAAASSLR